jgi:hypothetical protein
MNIVMITTWARPDLLNQSIRSLIDNAADWRSHDLTIVLDDERQNYSEQAHFARPASTLIRNNGRQGASASRNIGAGSIPRYRRQEHVLFLDDDVYMCQNWDMRLMQLAAAVGPGSIISGYSHPFNHCEPAMNLDGELRTLYGIPLVVSSVAMMMPWIVFDDVGPWDEPGGPGGSEDFALCMRARDKFGYRFAVTDPQCVIHTGLMSSGGTGIAGYKELCEQNDKLLDFWNIRGRVTFQ